MTFVTEHYVLADGGFALPTNGESGSKSLEFDPPNDVILKGLLHFPMLSFRADPSGGAHNLDLKVSLRPKDSSLKATVLQVTLAGTATRTFLEAVASKDFVKGPQSLIFEVDTSNGAGTVAISDVVLFFKRDV